MTAKQEERIEKALHECYRRLFKESTPRGDWDSLLANAEINERGEKVIPFLEYELEESKWDPIFDAVFTEYKIPKHIRGQFKFTIMLGASPKTKRGC
jgi:hypothetical protein